MTEKTPNQPRRRLIQFNVGGELREVIEAIMKEKGISAPEATKLCIEVERNRRIIDASRGEGLQTPEVDFVLSLLKR